MFTRLQFENNECSRQDYFAQFITPSIRKFVKENYSKEHLRQCYDEDQYLNNLDEVWSTKFDEFTLSIKEEIAHINKKINGVSVYSLSTGTCAIKAYMRIYANLNQETKELV
jgi:hypothetical protein